VVVFGDDSLNENSEDEGLEDANTVEQLNSLRMKLGGKKEETEQPDDEPSDAQLIATGEMDGEPEEELEETSEEPLPELSTALAKTGVTNISIRKQVRTRLLEGATREELLAEGFNKSTISTVASEVKKETGSRKPIGRAPQTTPKGMPIFAKGSPPEAIIESIEIPEVANGGGFAFEQGIKFGMSLVTIGIRMAQELSGIGIMQAKPLLDMAKSMREGEAIAAKNAAGEAAMEAAGLVRESMMPVLTNLQSRETAGGDPMKNMMVKTMEPIMQKVMGGMLGRLAPGAAAPQLPVGKGATEGKSATEGNSTVEGWTRRSE